MENYGPDLPDFPPRMVERASRGERKPWFARLPGILEHCREQWGLTLGRVVEEDNGNFVGFARLPDGEDAILKVVLPDSDLTAQMDALEIYAGRGICRLIALDRDRGAMLLERLRPGTLLADNPDRAERAEIAGRVLVDLHETRLPAEHNLPHFQDWMDEAFRDIGHCTDPERSRPYLDQMPRAQAILDRLKAPDEPQVLLHGDLHHWNILRDGSRGWMAIDPGGVTGASCLDAGRFIGNAMDFGGVTSRREMREILLESIRILSEVIGECEERVFAGAFCDKITSAGWGLYRQSGKRHAVSVEMMRVLVEVGGDVDEAKI